MQDLLPALFSTAGQAIEAGLNALPEPTRSAVANAIADGGWPELRIGVLNEAASVRLMLCNLDGRAIELARVDHAPS